MALYDFQMTQSGDIDLDKLAQVTPLYGEPAVEQIVKRAISLWLGNWFKDLSRGVDWLNIMKAGYNQSEVISILKAAIKKIIYVTDVVDVSLKVTDRNALIAYTVKADGLTVSGVEGVA